MDAPETFPFFTGKAVASPPRTPRLPMPARARRSDPAAYVVDEAVAHAVNVALLLGQPLLVTGEPGTGKTQLAARLAWELGLDEPLVFNTKSDSVARDLFYRFDSLRRFHAAQTREGSQQNIDYVDYQALGLAILWSRTPDEVAHLLPSGMAHPGQRRSVVLVDEIDKAPRDFTNDLLDEFDRMAFRAPELQLGGSAGVGAAAGFKGDIAAADDFRPVLVLTSNLERNLPDAFLRRCVFCHIPPPDAARLRQIVEARLPGLAPGRMLDSALELFAEIRKLGLNKPPATAELLDWLASLRAWGARVDADLKTAPEALRRSGSSLAKNADDSAELSRFVELYLQR